MDGSAGIKREAQRLVERLPEQASWDDLMYEIYVRQAVDRGIADADAGKVVSHDEARQRHLHQLPLLLVQQRRATHTSG